MQEYPHSRMVNKKKLCVVIISREINMSAKLIIQCRRLSKEIACSNMWSRLHFAWNLTKNVQELGPSFISRDNTLVLLGYGTCRHNHR